MPPLQNPNQEHMKPTEGRPPSVGFLFQHKIKGRRASWLDYFDPWLHHNDYIINDYIVIRVWYYTGVCVDALSLGLQHGEVEVDELEVAGGCGIVPPPQLGIEHLGHGTHTSVDLHTHLSYGFLEIKKEKQLFSTSEMTYVTME